MDNNKGAIELSIGAIVIIVLSASMLILGSVLVKNILSENKEEEIQTCFLQEIVDFNCSDGQSGIVLPITFEAITNISSNNCTSIHKFNCLGEE